MTTYVNLPLEATQAQVDQAVSDAWDLGDADIRLRIGGRPALANLAINRRSASRHASQPDSHAAPTLALVLCLAVLACAVLLWAWAQQYHVINITMAPMRWTRSSALTTTPATMSSASTAERRGRSVFVNALLFMPVLLGMGAAIRYVISATVPGLTRRGLILLLVAAGLVVQNLAVATLGVLPQHGGVAGLRPSDYPRHRWRHHAGLRQLDRSNPEGD